MSVRLERWRMQLTAVGFVVLAVVIVVGARPVLAAGGAGSVTASPVADQSDCSNHRIPIAIQNGTSKPAHVAVSYELQSQEPSDPQNGLNGATATSWTSQSVSPNPIPAGQSVTVKVPSVSQDSTMADFTIKANGQNVSGSPFENVDVCQGVTSPLSPQGVTNAITGDVLTSMAQSIANGAFWVVGLADDAVNSNTDAQLTSSWLLQNYSDIWAVSLGVMLLLFLAAVISAVARADGWAITRLVWVDAPTAVLLTATAVAIVGALLVATDELTTIVAGPNFQAFQGYVSSMEGSYKAASSSSDLGSAALAMGISLLTMIGAGVIWIELLLREFGLELVVMFLPLAFAGIVWPTTRRWAYRAVEVMIGLILAKFVIVVVFSIGVDALSQATLPGATGSATTASQLNFDHPGAMFAGALLILGAAFMPGMIGGLLPIGAAHAVQGIAAGRLGSAASRQAAQAGGTAYSKAVAGVRKGFVGGSSAVRTGVGAMVGVPAGYAVDVATYQGRRAVGAAANAAGNTRVGSAVRGAAERVSAGAARVHQGAEALRGNTLVPAEGAGANGGDAALSNGGPPVNGARPAAGRRPTGAQEQLATWKRIGGKPGGGES